MAFVVVVVVPRLLAAAAGGSTMATIHDPEESDDDSDGDDEEARVVMSSTPPAAAAALEGEGRGFLITEKPKAVRSTKLLAPPLPGGEGRLVEELLLFRLLVVASFFWLSLLPMFKDCDRGSDSNHSSNRESSNNLKIACVIRRRLIEEEWL